MTNTAHPAAGNTISKAEAVSYANEVRLPTRPLFQKPAGDFESKDIPLLSSLEEGWFIEFKDRLPDTAKLARSISSFANSHGGLLVIGAKEEQKTRRLAHLTPMCAEAAEQCILRSREAVTSHVTPTPYFEAKAVEVDSLDGAIEDRWIVVVSVPKGARGPYLHSNGCIYVRVGDAAVPHPLSDLTQQERMWAESMTRKAELSNRIKSLSDQGRHGAPSVHLVILADDVDTSSEKLTFDEFREIALARHGKKVGAVFDHVQSLDTSFIARRTERRIEAGSLLWDYDRQRKLHFIQIPIATHVWSGDKLENSATQFGMEELAQQLSGRKTPENLMILDLIPTYFFLSIVIRKVHLLHKGQGFKGELKMNARVVDAKGTIPFLGTPGYFAEVEATNFPYVTRDVGFFAGLEDLSKWLSIAVESEAVTIDEDLQVDVANAMVLFSRIAQSVGIPPYVSLGIRNDDFSTADWQPISGMIWKLYISNFSFTSQNNPKASQ